MSNVTSPKEIAASLTELWSPRVVAEVDDAYIKVARVHGSLAWHRRENEDELFLILEGRLRIEMKSMSVQLGEAKCLCCRRMCGTIRWRMRSVTRC